MFLPDGKEEVKAGDYQKFQAELKASEGGEREEGGGEGGRLRDHVSLRCDPRLARAETRTPRLGFPNAIRHYSLRTSRARALSSLQRRGFLGVVLVAATHDTSQAPQKPPHAAERPAAHHARRVQRRARDAER